MPYDAAANWIVPLRRAVVTEQQDYASLVTAWADALSLPEHEGRITEWYDIEEGRYERALGRLYAWINTLDASSPASVAVDELNTFDTSGPFWVRLWKGPVRVLRELDAGSPSLELDESTGEVRNLDARFLTGDVVEFPLFRFLGLCGKANYARLRFNGMGSPFLGDSVVTGSDEVPSGENILHDNLLAMRLQLIFNLGMAAFWDDEIVYRRRARNGGLLGAAEGSNIYARGMMFGATLAVRVRPDEDHTAPSAPHWAFGALHWGRPGARVVPTLDSYQRVLLPSQPLTPCWSCSPSTLAVTFFLLDLDRPGAGEVATEYEDGTFAAMQPRRISRADLLGSERPADAEIPLNLLPEAPGSGTVGGVRQAPQRLGDLTVSGLYRHEQTIIKIFPASRLLSLGDRNAQPTIGFFSLYNPATGVDYHSGEAGAVSRGELWKFEAAGAMHVTGTQRMGAAPHHWDRIENAQVTFYKIPANGRYGPGYHGIWYRQQAPSQAQLVRLQSFSHFITFDLDAETLAEVYAPGTVFRPIISADNRLNIITRTEDDTDDYRHLYAERAVPFLTLDEFSAATDYPPASSLLASIRSAESSGHT